MQGGLFRVVQNEQDMRDIFERKKRKGLNAFTDTQELAGGSGF